ncbi:unnamed protein product, partial [Medioppia subpectinata]
MLSCFISSISSTPEMAMVLLTPFTVIVEMFAGLFINSGELPGWLSWLKYTSFLHYSYETLMVNQWRYIDYIPCLNDSQSMGQCYKNGTSVIISQGFSVSNIYWDPIIGKQRLETFLHLNQCKTHSNALTGPRTEWEVCIGCDVSNIWAHKSVGSEGKRVGIVVRVVLYGIHRDLNHYSLINAKRRSVATTSAQHYVLLRHSLQPNVCRIFAQSFRYNGVEEWESAKGVVVYVSVVCIKRLSGLRHQPVLNYTRVDNWEVKPPMRNALHWSTISFSVNFLFKISLEIRFPAIDSLTLLLGTRRAASVSAPAVITSDDIIEIRVTRLSAAAEEPPPDRAIGHTCGHNHCHQFLTPVSRKHGVGFREERMVWLRIGMKFGGKRCAGDHIHSIFTHQSFDIHLRSLTTGGHPLVQSVHKLVTTLVDEWVQAFQFAGSECGAHYKSESFPLVVVGVEE